MKWRRDTSVSLSLNKAVLFLVPLIFAELSVKTGSPVFLAMLVLSLAIYYYRFKSFSPVKVLPFVVFAALFVKAVRVSMPTDIVKWVELSEGDRYKVKILSGKTIYTDEPAQIGDIYLGEGRFEHTPFNLMLAFNKLRCSLCEAYLERIPYPISALDISCVLGNRDYLPESLKAYMAILGIYHFLAISGLHIGILFAMFFFILEALKVKEPLLISCALTGLILPLTGFPISAVRAFFLILLVAVGIKLEQEPNLIYLTLLTLLITLIFSQPNLSMLLSYLSVLSIFYFLGKGHKIFAIFSPFFVTFPIVAEVFKVINPASAVLTLVLSPIFSAFLLSTIFSPLPLLSKINFILGSVFIEAVKLSFSVFKATAVAISLPKVFIFAFYFCILLLILFDFGREAILFLVLSFSIAVFFFKTPQKRGNFFIKGFKLNSARFLSGQGQAFNGATIKSNYILPWTKRCLWKSKLIDVRLKERYK